MSATKTFDKSPLARVSRRNRCPICDHTDWCSVSKDGALAICMRSSDGAIRNAKNGGFVHVLKPYERDFQPKLPRIHHQQIKSLLAPIDRRHLIYTALLESLSLNEQHADKLLLRGLSDTEASRNLYASLPDSRTAKKICAELAKQFDLSGVPGFFRERDQWRLAVWSTGFFIPVRDIQGRIQSCQIRFDEGDTRYLWFSSPNKDGGASSGTPVHFARVWRAASTGEGLITEGALKADIIAEQLDACVIAVAGVSSFNNDFGMWLRAQLPALSTVLVALDRDWHTNPQVSQAMFRLVTSLKKANLNGGMLDWERAKGLDDLLTSEEATHA